MRFKTYFEYYDRYQNYFSITPILLKGVHKDSINIREIFWGVEMEIGPLV